MKKVKHCNCGYPEDDHDFRHPFIEAKLIATDMENLTPNEIAELPFGKKCRYGIADRYTKLLILSSDSERWVRAELQRLSNVRYQFVTNI